ncbi:RNA polymerase subunit sigma-70 [Pedobacter ginsengisoli]|uniref:RNA polymerase subunit sigma-70 n=1 Tax=Pedobacter ginsengisoli TaxID=363852 RepID=A0A2D1U9C3_9SPHI|nr:sigma-70 family RNA polymerase sigma factor [Pedobacter ginsengisoli]ATP58182.1 RNA polymerase subunit sigma-70 [Pedobacter ginsengisoli]
MNHLRSLLATYAYNITGSYEVSQDIVQDVFLKFLEVDRADVINEKAYLVRSVVNMAINYKKRSERVQHEYPGIWLPEPIDTNEADSTLNREDVLSYSLMVLLEKLTPQQRAVFILKEGFDYNHAEIAELLEITISNSRQILKRAKQCIQERRKLAKNNAERELVLKYRNAIKNGDVRELELMLKDDISVISDGGGKVLAALKPISGRANVIRFLNGLQAKFFSKRSFKYGLINHQQAMFHYEGGVMVSCQIFVFEQDEIANIFFIRNPDKLSRFEHSDCL